MVSLYGGSDFPNDLRRSARVMRDIVFMCSDRELANAWSKSGASTHLFTFSFNFANVIERTLGDAHAFELPFVWKNYDKVLGSLASDMQNYSQMSDIMSCSWASWVKCQETRCSVPPPNCADTLKDLPDWPQYDKATRQYYSFKLPVSVAGIQKSEHYPTDNFPGDDRCDFWAQADLDFRNVRKKIRDKWMPKRNALNILV